jgi:hypothetical protein
MKNVTLCTDIGICHLQSLLNHYQLEIIQSDDNNEIPGSHWGDEEAGLIENRLYIRSDTPVHSLLHEACHYICMDVERRQHLHTDAGGDYDEENGVCYLQILLSDFLPDYSKNKMFHDMNEWGYSFRLGSAERWFKDDAEDALLWLQHHNLLDDNNLPNWKIRL